jgi:hypothetical protein
MHNSCPAFPGELRKGMTGVELIDSAFRLLFTAKAVFTMYRIAFHNVKLYFRFNNLI